MKIIVRVRELRKNHNLTQEELARQLNISRQSLISLEQGRWLPSLPLAFQLADFFHTPIHEVVAFKTEGRENKKETLMTEDFESWPPLKDLPATQALNQAARAGNPFVNPSFPAINVRQDADNIYLEAHVPGFSEKDIDIDIADDMVTIMGNVTTSKTDSGQSSGYLRQEYSQQSFSRSLGLPVPIVSDKATAKLVNGILTLTLPKIAQEQPKTRRLKPTVES